MDKTAAKVLFGLLCIAFGCFAMNWNKDGGTIAAIFGAVVIAWTLKDAWEAQ